MLHCVDTFASNQVSLYHSSLWTVSHESLVCFVFGKFICRLFQFLIVIDRRIMVTKWSEKSVDKKSVSSAYVQCWFWCVSGRPSYVSMCSFSAASRYMMNSTGDNAHLCGVSIFRWWHWLLWWWSECLRELTVVFCAESSICLVDFTGWYSYTPWISQQFGCFLT